MVRGKHLVQYVSNRRVNKKNPVFSSASREDFMDLGEWGKAVQFSASFHGKTMNVTALLQLEGIASSHLGMERRGVRKSDNSLLNFCVCSWTTRLSSSRCLWCLWCVSRGYLPPHPLILQWILQNFLNLFAQFPL